MSDKKDLSLQQLKGMEAQGKEATNERITRLESTVKAETFTKNDNTTDMELVLIMEVCRAL